MSRSSETFQRPASPPKDIRDHVPEISPATGRVARKLLESLEASESVLFEEFKVLHPGGVNQPGRDAIVDLKQSLAPVLARTRQLAARLSHLLKRLDDLPCDKREDCN